uniref:Uncharacterized protein n=1 Tax=viral metagenome TaxID=1070528 RepID=A0A6M3KXL7_9ZZZZ
MCFGGGGGYSPPLVADTPAKSDPEIQAALQRERELQRRRRGRSSTILTSGLGLSDTNKKTTLGS